jgi:hypothetical protein
MVLKSVGPFVEIGTYSKKMPGWAGWINTKKGLHFVDKEGEIFFFGLTPVAKVEETK